MHEEADILEHVISEKLEDRIAAALGYPEFDPHGAPIPTKEGEMAELSLIPLSQMEVGQSGRVSRIADDEDGELLRYCSAMGLIPGAQLTVHGRALLDGPLTLTVEDEPNRIIGFNASRSILIEL